MVLIDTGGIVHAHRKDPGEGCEVYIDMLLATWHCLTAAHKTKVVCRGNPYISLVIQQNSMV